MLNTQEEIKVIKPVGTKQYKGNYDALLNEICKTLNYNVNFHCMTKCSFYLEIRNPKIKRKIYDIAHRHGYHAGEVINGKYQNCIKIYVEEN